MTSIAQVRQLRLSLTAESGPVEILRGIDFDIIAGESLGIVGPSGSGKSTLLMVLAGLERASSGEVKLLGEDLMRMSEDELALFRRDHAGIVFQSFHLIPTMTALENVAVPLELRGDAHAFDKAEAMLGEVGLAARTGHYPSQLSGGEQQRVALARALAGEPKILFADEPTGNLDGRNGAHVVELLFGLKARLGTTLVLVTHDLQLASRCDRTIRLKDGSIERIEECAGRAKPALASAPPPATRAAAQ